MELKIIHSKKKLDVSDQVFSCDFNNALIHQVVTAYMAAGRAGTKAQKTRAEVRGGGAKPWRQKGTGRARAGTIRSPIWRTGGVTFAAKPRSFVQKVNKKMFKGAVRSILSELVRLERLLLVSTFEVESPKTKLVLQLLDKLKIEGSVLIITDTISENLYLSARNLPHLKILDVAAATADPVSLIKFECVIITEKAVKEMEALLA